jgi:hypothetical protein
LLSVLRAGLRAPAGTASIRKTTITPKDSGPFKIEGICKLNGVPSAGYLVLLFRAGQSRCVAGARCSQDGSFSFLNLAAGEYTVIGTDLDDSRKGVIFANVASVAM